VGCGGCDTPELWRGAAGLCARVRVRACAGAAESLRTYIYTCRRAGAVGLPVVSRSLGLCVTMLSCGAVVCAYS